ncbi:hypothetical protein BSKO_10085 [Bryopsis sp. KO-2023]|nr:hypothetical protein BSKO_10085 [Bryopsis sp. KO-2023]
MAKRKSRSSTSVSKSGSLPGKDSRTDVNSSGTAANGASSGKEETSAGKSTSRVLVVDRRTVASAQSSLPASRSDPRDLSSAPNFPARTRSSNGVAGVSDVVGTSRSATASGARGRGSRNGSGSGHSYFTRSKQPRPDANHKPPPPEKGKPKSSKKTPISAETEPVPNPSRIPPIPGKEGGFMELSKGTGAFVGYWKDVFNSSEEIMEQLRTEVEWLDKEVVVRGQRKKQPRLIAYMADSEDLTYTYSGLKLWPKDYTHTVRKIKEVLQGGGYGGEKLDFNCVLMNYYRDGEDNVAWHADDEPLFGQNPTIGSVSFGARRDFILRSNSDALQKFVYKLGGGDILVMKGTTQELYKHSVPKRKSIGLGRINLTFRKIVEKERLRKGEVSPQEHQGLKLKISSAQSENIDSEVVD